MPDLPDMPDPLTTSLNDYQMAAKGQWDAARAAAQKAAGKEPKNIKAMTPAEVAAFERTTGVRVHPSYKGR